MCLLQGFVGEESCSILSLLNDSIITLTDSRLPLNLQPPPSPPFKFNTRPHCFSVSSVPKAIQSGHLFLSEWSWQSCFCAEAILDLIGDLLGAGPRGGGGNGVTGSVFGKDQLKVESKEEKKNEMWVRCLEGGFAWAVCVRAVLPILQKWPWHLFGIRKQTGSGLEQMALKGILNLEWQIPGSFLQGSQDNSGCRGGVLMSERSLAAVSPLRSGIHHPH